MIVRITINTYLSQSPDVQFHFGNWWRIVVGRP